MKRGGKSKRLGGILFKQRIPQSRTAGKKGGKGRNMSGREGTFTCDRKRGLEGNWGGERDW